MRNNVEQAPRTDEAAAAASLTCAPPPEIVAKDGAANSATGDGATFGMVMGLGWTLGLALACCFCLVRAHNSDGARTLGNETPGGGADNNIELGDANSKLHAHVQLCALCLADNKALALAPRMRLWGVFFCCLFQ